ncbi:LOW QUALITY PROTEIN: hypothetical protein BRADI_5g16655v3 [Brachypodium distachyon]|uniref:NPH3 domain-containing protein n=1 Tax=Brachypodium distachyon TaxID=15368 RepID=A0A2K2CHQ1_BRADI|nr:LOW QUALITY PROTEIN: hypothetical protein BRADI_5g16655v3 [Brachypodium distachyon]
MLALLALPDHARIYDDSVYCAVDIYLKAHPQLAAEERDRVCGVVDCRKLTVEACTHAAQNERLPLRAMLQVLFFEQLQQRRRHSAGGPATSEAWRASVVRVDMDGVSRQVQGLERECSSMRRTIKKIDGRSGARSSPARSADADAEDDGGGPRSRYGCKFSTQVCDSQARNVVAASRASRMGMNP